MRSGQVSCSPLSLVRCQLTVEGRGGLTFLVFWKLLRMNEARFGAAGAKGLMGEGVVLHGELSTLEVIFRG